MIDLNEKALEIFEQNKLAGWWDNIDRCVYETLQLVSTEIAEATEGERKNLADDHLPDRRMGEVELADALIRLLDMAGRYDWFYDEKLESDMSFPGVSPSVGKLHFHCNIMIVGLGLSIHEPDETYDVNYAYTGCVNAILDTAETLHYDIFDAMNEKLEYNKHRADHKRENRQKENGKKF